MRPDLPRQGIRAKGATRPGLTAALDHMRRGDTLVVLDLTRLGHDTRDSSPSTKTTCTPTVATSAPSTESCSTPATTCPAN
ncbi:recombinase family protein [Micromonospora sp. NPDC005215]|uniref:recombinase family protein n=1 Tax=Micromonospora sp. NPDC005215 TaxID=3157024 RepID=UPI0033BA0E1C